MSECECEWEVMQDNRRVVRYLISGESNELTIGHIPAPPEYMHSHFYYPLLIHPNALYIIIGIRFASKSLQRT